jgi:hypothetical protein
LNIQLPFHLPRASTYYPLKLYGIGEGLPLVMVLLVPFEAEEFSVFDSGVEPEMKVEA